MKQPTGTGTASTQPGRASAFASSMMRTTRTIKSLKRIKIILAKAKQRPSPKTNNENEKEKEQEEEDKASHSISNTAAHIFAN